jgi:hypothetical protein
MLYYGSSIASYSVIFPPTMRCGDSWEFSLYSPDYTSPQAEGGPWNPATAIFASGIAQISSVATIDGTTFEWVVPPTDTKTFPTGPASYVIQVDNGAGGLRRTLEQGAIQVVADISVGGGVPIDAQTVLQKQLAAADQCLLDLLGQRTSMVSFGGKQYQLWNIKDLWTVRNALFARVAAEEEENSGNMRARIIVPTFINL